MLAFVIVNSGFSASILGLFGNSPFSAPRRGSGSHAGIVPSLLPAFSAPMGVRVLPSSAASCAETFATAGTAVMARTSAPVKRAYCFYIVAPPRYEEARVGNEWVRHVRN